MNGYSSTRERFAFSCRGSAHLAGIAEAAQLRSQPRSGAFLKNLVLADIDAWREAVAPKPDILYWRTAGGVEVDFVVEQRIRLLPIEVKTASRARAADGAGVERFLTQDRRARWGMVVHTGPDLYRLSEHVLAAPLALLVG